MSRDVRRKIVARKGCLEVCSLRGGYKDSPGGNALDTTSGGGLWGSGVC
jgi:hypothetical protein